MSQQRMNVALVAFGASALLLPATTFAQEGGGFVDPTAPDATEVPSPAPAPVYNPPAPSTKIDAAQSDIDSDASSDTSLGGNTLLRENTLRPEGMSFGLGFNYILGGAELNRPNGASLRVRLANGLTFEPFVRLGTSGQSRNDGDVKDAQNEFTLGATGRLPLKSRGKVDLVAVAGVGLGYFGSDPDGNDNNTTTLTFGINYGLSLEYWLTEHWNISFTARNQFFQHRSVSQEFSDDLNESYTDIGIIWDPTVEAAAHLFF